MDRPAWKEMLTEQGRKGAAHLGQYWQAVRKNDTADAFEAGVEAIVEGYLHYACMDHELRENLAKWEKDAKKNKLSKPALKGYEGVVKPYGEAVKDGWQAFNAIKADVR